MPLTPTPFNDLHLDDGSFEDSPGFGWDTCFTNTPGAVRSSEVGASDGDTFIELTSATCESICSPSNPAESQFYVWFGEDLAPTPGGLYLDLVNLDLATPDGRLNVYAVDSACETRRPLVDVPLTDLALTPSWSTRCFDITLEPSDGLGFAVDGARFHLGLDALRFGPRCQ